MTTAESVLAPSQTAFRKWVLLGALFSVFLGVRLIALEADPPSGLSWSAGIFTDEGIYAADARSVALTGHWAPGDFHSAIVAPLLHLIQLTVFTIFGVGLLQARLISVVFSLATLAMFYEAMHSQYNDRTALIGVTFLGLSVPYVLYNRLALLETPTLFVLVAAYLVWTKDGSRFLVGLLLGVAFAFKPLALLAAPAFIIAMWPSHRGVLQILAGLSTALLTYGLIWYLPHRATLSRMNDYYAFHQYLPHSWHGTAHNLSRGLWTGDSDGILPYLIHHEMILSILVVMSIFATRAVYHNDRLLIAWLLMPLVAFLFVSYTPSRYFILFWPPLAALAARSLAAKPVTAVIAVVCLFGGVCLTQMFMLWHERTYNLIENGRNLPLLVSGRTLVAGQFAPELCLSNRLTCMYTQPGLANDHIMSGLDGHDAVMLVTRSAYWDSWWLKESIGKRDRKSRISISISPKFVLDVYFCRLNVIRG